MPPILRSRLCAAPAAALLLFVLAGGTSMSRAIEQLRGAAMRPVPVVPQRVVPRPDMVWVPDRYVAFPGAPQGVHVPGHWERRISEREFYVPPLTVCDPATSCQTIPAGVRAPADFRGGP